MATYALCISASAVVVLVQTVVFFIRDPQFTGWAQSDFAALTFLQAGFTLVGFIITVLAYYSSDSTSDSQLLTNEEEQQYGSTINTTTNTGILISCLVAASMAIFSMALLGFPVYGYATLIVVSMVNKG